MNEPLGEDLIRIWLRMSGVIKNNRLISTMTFNEIFVCNILYQQKQEHTERLTASEIGQRTKLLKSQMNKIICSLESQGLIQRIRSTEDKRKVYLELNEDKIDLYLAEHERVLSMLNQLITTIGEEKIQQVIRLMNEITDTMETITDTNRKESCQ